MTVDELCDLLKVTRQTIHVWIKDGKIRAIKMGRVTRFEKSEVERFIEESKTQTPAA